MRASICIATYDKPLQMQQVLESIYRQKPPFEFEVIVVDDGSPNYETKAVCKRFPIRYHRVQRTPEFRNPCTARNIAYRKARGDIVIAQAEIAHVGLNTIDQLVTTLCPGQFLIAKVVCLSPTGKVCGTYTSPQRKRPYFFLGSLHRSDLYAIGGNDEEFSIAPAYDDDWFGQCLLNGLDLIPVYSPAIIGHHLYHPLSNDLSTEWKTKRLYDTKCRQARLGKIPWAASSGPWLYTPGQSLEETREKTTQERFTEIYEGEEFYDSSAGITEKSSCGAGSTLEATQAIREKLPSLLKQLRVKNLLDACCGNGKWIREIDLGTTTYLGVDITRTLIKRNQQEYGSNGYQYQQLDLIKTTPPTADLVLCRDAIVHFSFADARAAISNICKSNSKYVLTTTFTKRKNNRSIQTGDWAPYNLQLPPFNFPSPLEVIDEECREHDPHFRDKFLGLWKISELAKQL